jgi:putative ubiquitin-RnfH superfamily antitoxin RatB of RatAB toxin-antitoxin module
MKRCTVVFALPDRQWSWEIVLGDAGTAGQALEQARVAAGSLDVPWDAPIGIFGALCDRNALLRDGDRVEIYRPLRADPKESRRERARAGKKAQDSAASRPRSRSGS